MSWNAPQNWAEVLSSVERGFAAHSVRLGIRIERADAVCGHYSTRAVLMGHLDDFARHIIASNDALNERYMASNRWQAERDDDVSLFVVRDGNALAYVTRSGEVVVNPRAEIGARRYRDALARLIPSLERFGHALRVDRKSGYAARERAEAREAGLLVDSEVSA